MRFALGRRGRKVIAAAAVATAALVFSASAGTQTKVALIIGNGAYRNVPELPNPPNDSSDVAAAFERLGFSVHLVTNASYDEMRRALLDFSRKARDSEMAVVFFAGHGMEVGGENWLIPVDAELKTDLDAAQEAISLRAVMVLVSTASKLGLIVLDACRNNPFLSKIKWSIATRSVERGFSRVEPMNNVLVAYAAKDGTIAIDGAGRNSPFTAALLNYLERPGLEINFLFRNVRDEVIAATRNQQQPFIYGSLSKEAIYLIPPLYTPTPDQVAWSLLKETTDEAALKRFTAQYPNSALRTDAEARIAALAAAQVAKPVPPSPDEVTWVLLKETTDEAALKRFVVQYPDSGLRKEAEARIAALEAAQTAKRLPPSPDEVTWVLLRDTTDQAALKRFTTQYPNSALRKDAEARIAALETAATAVPLVVPDRHEQARSLQFELKRVGCFAGAVNGEFDEATKAAWHHFTKLTSINLPDDALSDAIKAVRGIDKRVCPLVCPDGERAQDDRCVATPSPYKAESPRTRGNSRNTSTSAQALEDAELESYVIRPAGTIPTGTTAVLTARNGRKMTCIGGILGQVRRKCSWN